ANDGVCVAIEINAVPQHARISSEEAVPGCVADDASLSKPKRLVLRTEDAPQPRRYTENRKIARAACHQFNSFRVISASEIRANWPHSRDLIKDTGPLAQVVEFQCTEADIRSASRRFVGGDRNQLRWT